MKPVSQNPYEHHEVYIVDGRRTPQLKVMGPPGPFRASDLAVSAARQLLLTLPFPADALDEVIFGCVSSGPDEANIARVIALRLGCGDKVPAMTVQRNCASGMQAQDCAAARIASGQADLILAGGTEAMSHHPVLLNNAMVTWLAQWNQARNLKQRARVLGKLKPGYLQPIIALLRGLTDPVVGLSMGQTAEQLAEDFGISREAMDRFALRSHQRLAAAVEAGHLEEIVPLIDSKGNVYSKDNGLRPDSTMEKLARLKPVFDRPFGKVTAGNSAQVTDGAACLLLASTRAVEKHDLPVLGRLRECHWAGLEPERMGLGPVYAMAPIMANQQLNTEDIDYWEINEAFAAQILACLQAWQDENFCRNHLNLSQAFQAISEDHLNVDGGGISLGHPVGASGARIVLHLLKTLERKNARLGMASLCIGGGQGGAMLVERSPS
ncbi:acetyl-CoA C-acetyltransferase [Thiolapillus brandeum]|uniref:Acetyl-CoA C-acetyltransferase n=1 Tax=Thiolapillus brandeum TaxID=1076588 RepID=A0A7U6JHN8_9GAMM|nr:acetyl-CoA C-acetyltransferase [Thiolapillus brandeum]BAO44664.1 acetyl-CoA C-acetyltransferase [Thiolapillus brandeum]